MKARLSVLATAIVIGSSAFAQQQEPQGEEQFLMQAIQGDLAEIAMGELAQERGQSEEVREFGRRLVEDHSQALEKAQQVARSQGVEIPEEPSPEAQQTHQQLMQLSGQEFDREFVRHMIEDHEKRIGLFEAQAEEGDSEAAEHAEQTLPALEEHLQIAESIEAGGRG